MTPAGKMKPFCKTFLSSAFVVSPHFCLIVQYFLLLHVLDVYTYFGLSLSSLDNLSPIPDPVDETARVNPQFVVPKSRQYPAVEIQL